jgi:hypothetical protein
MVSPGTARTSSGTSTVTCASLGFSDSAFALAVLARSSWPGLAAIAATSAYCAQALASLPAFS